MIVTNKFNLPEVFVNIASRNYKGSDNYTASGMTKSIRQLWLERRHRDEIETDVADSLWAILGSAVHNVLEKGQEDNALTEQYLKTEIAGCVFSGMADHYIDKTISDYKFTSVWSYVYLKDSIDNHKIQLNSYKYLYESAGFDVDKLQIVFIFKDWNKFKAFDAGYPDSPIKVVDIPIMPDIEQFLIDTINNREKYRYITDYDLPYCTPAERWAKPVTWAVMKEGRKTAVRVLNTEEEGLAYIVKNGLDKAHYVTERKGAEWTRCEYCGGKAFCNQYREGNESL